MQGSPQAVAEISCIGKERFTSFVLAQSVANRPTRREGKKGMSAYHCNHCHGWHVGHKDIFKKAGKA